MNPKLIAYGLAALVGAGAVSGIWWHGNSHGKRAAEAAYQAAVEGLRNDNRKLADELDQERARRAGEVRERVRTIYLEPDPTGCADATALDGVLRALRPGPSGPTPDQ